MRKPKSWLTFLVQRLIVRLNAFGVGVKFISREMFTATRYLKRAKQA